MDQRRRPEGVWMRANQNSLQEHNIYPKPNLMPLFKLGQDRIAIDKLSVLRTGLGTAIETRNSASKIMSEIDDKN
jgi:hypothetical protein